MGSCVIVFPNVRDYHFKIFEPSSSLNDIISQHEMEVLLHIKMSTEETWQHVTVSSLLLEKAMKQDHRIEKMMEAKDQKWTFVEQLTQQQTMNADLYARIKHKCNSVQSRSVLEIVEQAFKQKKLFSFEKPGKIYDLNLNDPLDKRLCEQLPKQYLLLELKQTYQISIVRGSKVQLIMESPYNESLILQIIRKACTQYEPVQTTFTTYSIINEIIKEGNYAKADILCSDLFGLQGCQAFKIPPRLIASSLAKFASEGEPSSSIYDQLQSVVLSFGVNLGKLASQVAQKHNIKSAIFVSNEITHKRFLHFVATPFAMVGNIWFVQGQRILQNLYGKECCK